MKARRLYRYVSGRFNVEILMGHNNEFLVKAGGNLLRVYPSVRGFCLHIPEPNVPIGSDLIKVTGKSGFECQRCHELEPEANPVLSSPREEVL